MDTALIIAAMALCLYAAATDMKRLEIDNWVSIAVAALFILYGLFTPVVWGAHIVIGLVILVIGILINRMGLIGGGDVKLIAALSLWAGAQYLPVFLLGTSFAGALVALATLAMGRKKLFTEPTGLAWIDAASTEKPHVAYAIAIAIGAACMFLQMGG